MPIRDFIDGEGVRWHVWATTPIRGNVRPQFASGWLAFESAAERRRLAPIPSGWSDAGDAALLDLLARASPVTRDPEAAAQLLTPARSDPGPAPGSTPLESTVARVRAAIRAVEDSWQHRAKG